MVHIPQKLIVHYHHCSIKGVGEFFIDCLTVQLLFLKTVLNCPFVHLVGEAHPFSSYGSYPYAFNTLEGNILFGEEIIDYMKNVYLFDSIAYEPYFGVVNELKAILEYFLWVDDEIYHNFTKKIYKDRFFCLYYIYLTRRLRRENYEKCQMTGLDNHNLNITRLKKILSILEEVLCSGDNSTGEGRDVCYFDCLCFSILSILYSLPSKFNEDLQRALLSQPSLIEFVRSLNQRYGVWGNEKSFLQGVSEAKCLSPG
ncbi:conserved Plasmodium protein, unknown function [Plasmodium vivax]|uniref:Uncharacterized protein n=6 Tax=Plasmodium vivax TaxID=5855 RepID=A5K3T7_PLAVS|nr:hypothetical protein PVX_118125 [Plasmodium vivax]KMZ78888.1 hypothetical protein PVIIG_00283 [Plasmodium vivax India VII]KMZ87096.1 hypothetical protein PVBG_03881 [Plasmodium vivax Brazil I]KMZ91734.1 hypothetical protein PVMG_00607 [Plasmodium vivax Mauritania I]KMZ97833.1 hypothetical protein PVNG_06239 [Plasmodium vivax North Korean]EDL46191.1 hypothetical protein PVX_118125 [Plasmodium vivax]|eukprot:XP_001615918.1 hypothetical protein [Plasmodium vivax Sal-1]